MKWRYFILSSIICGTWAGSVFAQGTTVSLALTPIQTAFVKGDVSRFRMMNWTKDGSQSGVRELLLDTKVGKDVKVSFEGNGMFGDTDYKGGMLVTKDDLGYVKLNYDSFRKYYDNKGGYYPKFTSSGMALQTLGQDLALDIGHFALEIGKGTPEDSNFSIGYERGTKKGIKDSTTWSYVKDYALGTNTTIDRRKISPASIAKDETTDTLTAKGKVEVAGFTVKGEQKYVFFKGNNLRDTSTYGSTNVQADNIQTLQREIPQTKELTSSVRAERWTLNDKTYISFGYNFGHLRNSMLRSDRDYMSNILYASGTFRDGIAENLMDTHTLAGQVLTSLTDKLTFISRFKGEFSTTHSNATEYTLDVNGNRTAATNSINENRLGSAAESFSLRYNGLAKTSLYADLDLKQEHNWQYLQQSTNYSSLVNNAPEGKGTIGMRVSPTNKITWTTEASYGKKTDKLNKGEYSYETSLGANTGFIRRLMTVSDDVSTRLAVKPVKWLENSFKVKASTNVYHMTSTTSTNAYLTAGWDETAIPTKENDFIYDIVLMPTDALMFDVSYGLQLSKVDGPSIANTGTPPAYTANVYTWALNSSYAPTEKLSFFNSFEYSRSRNSTNADGSNYTSTGTTLWGPDQEWYNIDTGIKWSLKKDLTIEPHYAYSAFRSYEGMEIGNYSANIVWLDVDMKF